MKANKNHLGSSVEFWLAEEGIVEESIISAMKAVLAWQLAQEMKTRRITKVKMAETMKTSRAQLDRVLDPTSGNVTIDTLERATRVVGRRLRVELV